MNNITTSSHQAVVIGRRVLRHSNSKRQGRDTYPSTLLIPCVPQRYAYHTISESLYHSDREHLYPTPLPYTHSYPMDDVVFPHCRIINPTKMSLLLTNLSLPSLRYLFLSQAFIFNLFSLLTHTVAWTPLIQLPKQWHKTSGHNTVPNTCSPRLLLPPNVPHVLRPCVVTQTWGDFFVELWLDTELNERVERKLSMRGRLERTGPCC